MTRDSSMSQAAWYGQVMQITELITRLNQGEFDRDITTEAEFKQQWLTIPTTSNPFVSAFHGGLLADRLSWVFIAAYQGAVRDCFPDIPDASFASFAVSEDQSGEFPGTSLDSNGRLNGCKSWIATSDTVELLLVTLGPGIDSGCVSIAANTSGVSISSKPAAAFLGDMSQGRASFDHVLLNDSSIDAGRAMNFGLAEPFFVMTAGCAFLIKEGRRIDHPEIAQEAERIVDLLQSLYANDYTRDVKALLEVHNMLAPLGKQCSTYFVDEGSWQSKDWQVNGRLLGIYGRSLRDRVSKLAG